MKKVMVLMILLIGCKDEQVTINPTIANPSFIGSIEPWKNVTMEGVNGVNWSYDPEQQAVRVSGKGHTNLLMQANNLPAGYYIIEALVVGKGLMYLYGADKEGHYKFWYESIDTATTKQFLFRFPRTLNQIGFKVSGDTLFRTSNEFNITVKDFQIINYRPL